MKGREVVLCGSWYRAADASFSLLALAFLVAMALWCGYYDACRVESKEVGEETTKCRAS